MPSETIGILHPGTMGISVAASALQSGHQVCYASAGRSNATLVRAAEHGLHNLETLPALCAACSIIISVCPPYAAGDLAEQVLACGFSGLYLDANAISPGASRRIGELLTSAGIAFVDGGVIGGPAWTPGETWLYLSGPEPDSKRITACFSAGLLEVRFIGQEVGRASALKMCYAAYTKGTTALLTSILALSESLGVRDDLYAQWERDDPGFPARTGTRARRVTSKAWRFAGEMDEIAETFEAENLPGGFHRAAGDIYRRLARFKTSENLPPLDEVLAALLEG